MKTFKQFLLEYEISKSDVIPSHTNEGDIDHENFTKRDLGTVEGHKVVHYRAKGKGSHFTFATDKDGNTVGSIEHKKPTVPGRLAVSNITKRGGPKGLMSKVLHHLVKHGHTLESDNTNTEGAHKMLMDLSSREGVNTHIEDGKGNRISHSGKVSDPENHSKFSIRSSDKDFLDNSKHKHVLVFSSKQ